MKKCISTYCRQAGLTMVELLVALALSAGVMGGVVSVLFVSKSNFISEQELAVLQENARFAMQHLTREIRMAGFNGCGRRPLNYANTLEGGPDSWYLSNTGIQGFEQGSAFPTEFSGDVNTNTDAVIVRRADDKGYSVAEHKPASARFELNKNHELIDGQIMVVASADCEQIGVFQISNANNSNINIVHNTGNGVMDPANCTKALTGNFNCNDPSPPRPGPSDKGNAYGAGSRVMEYISEAFYVGDSSVADGVPALFRERLDYSNVGTSLTTTEEELVQGVENMQLLYGVDSNGSDGQADTYQDANAVADWGRVVSVRLTLRMRSINPVYSSPQGYTALPGEPAASVVPDRFLRQVVSSTIQLRN